MGETIPRVVVRNGAGGSLLGHAREGRGYGAIEIVEVEGLGDVIEGTELERLLCEADVLVCGHHDDGNTLGQLADPAENL